MIVYASLATVRVLRHQLLLHLLPCRSLSSLAGRHHLSIKPSQWPTGCFTLESRVWSLQYSCSGLVVTHSSAATHYYSPLYLYYPQTQAASHCVSSSLDTRVCALVRVCVWKSVCDSASVHLPRPRHQYVLVTPFLDLKLVRTKKAGFSISSGYKVSTHQ